MFSSGSNRISPPLPLFQSTPPSYAGFVIPSVGPGDGHETSLGLRVSSGYHRRRRPTSYGPTDVLATGAGHDVVDDQSPRGLILRVTRRCLTLIL